MSESASARSLTDTLQPLRGAAWRNRIALAPLTNTQSPGGHLSQGEHDWLIARARGGMAFTLTAAAHVSPEGETFPGQMAVHSDAFLPGLERLASALNATGTVSAVQLQHGGARAVMVPEGERLAPWDDPAKGVRALTTGEVERVIGDFVAAAVRAERAGFAGVQVHGAHGYLLGQFLNAERNQRTDDYGGSVENRFRIIGEVLAEIRRATCPTFHVGLRLSPERYGIPLVEGVALASQVMASGLIDHLDLSLWDVFAAPHDTSVAGLLVEQFTSLPRHGTLLGVAGAIASAKDAAWCLDARADFVSVGRAAIAHHDFASRAVADPEFVADAPPYTRARLADEHVSPAFQDYLAAGWDGFVAD